MEPVPGTAEVLRDLAAHGEEGVARALLALSAVVDGLVPGCLGLSVELEGTGLTFALAPGDVREAPDLPHVAASTLLLDLLDLHGDLLGVVSLFGSDADSFDGREELLGSVLGTGAGTTVQHADLPDQARRRAAATAPAYAGLNEVEVAVGVLMSRHGIGEQEARRRIATTAERSGGTLPEAARELRRLGPT
jgi:hypothetical protein